MKRNIISRLLIAAALLTIIGSCRNDQFPEQETYNNSSQFQLTSKRISLNESKHKARLLPELEKAEAEFKAKTKTNVFGKVVNYGNGISINTDDVIYIENGPDFYTYTFKIERENAPENAPVENLVLSPLSDGSWREMLITYHLTDQEKQTMNAGGIVDLTGKVEYTPLESGTYSSAMKQDLVCYYKTSSYYTSCSENAHHHGEASDEDGGPCQADVQSVLVITVTRVCDMVGTETGSGTEPGVSHPQTGGGENTNNGINNPNNPCGGNGVPTQPQDPNSTLGTQEGCNTGVPTLPNLSSFSLFVSNLPPDLKNLLMTPANIEFYNGLQHFYDTNNASLEAKNFITWALNFLSQNPNISWEEFENWFMGTSEGQDGEYVNPDLIEYETPIIQQSLPTLSQWYANFPKKEENGYWKEMKAPQVYQLAGGSLYTSHSNDTTGAYQNACAIRGSRALLYSGIIIPVIKKGNLQLTQKGGDGKNYILAATSFLKFMKDKFGDTPHKLEGAEANNPQKVMNFLNGKNGIYVIENADPRPSNQGGAGYSGHVDAIVNGICISGSYTQPKGGVKSIRIWVLH
ncbi:hypothetical protein HNP38_000150 [Chryseobacterium defluvii]|uniref:Type VI secretion system (T6SS) effector Tae4 (Amidase) n=1 Tax=Chryseobacterium defluvii TaxID=160396 RepID=A0A840KA69_9FLAO|nr:type VI secretion system amidase effector protein Tae4 [Chryseobacterium defluvii]MBB4804878.1 hypothetical protein [Chryseobacterium defluvii]